MNSTELYEFLFAWLSGLLPGVTIIATHDNGPAPEGNYVALNIDGNWKFQGTTPSHQTNDPTLVSPRVHQYSVQVEVREIDGHGDHLRTLTESLDTQDSRDYFRDAGCAVTTFQGPDFIPALVSSAWRREYLLRLDLNVARGDSGTLNYIETVETINNLGGT
jgi:hypothetical protein